MMYWRLVAAVFWLVLGGTLLGIRWLYPDMAQWRWELAGVPAGWIAIVFALYNLAQMGVAYFMRRRATQEAAALRSQHRQPSASPPPELDPNFQFNDPTPE
jgi:hypothetical protein